MQFLKIPQIAGQDRVDRKAPKTTLKIFKRDLLDRILPNRLEADQDRDQERRKAAKGNTTFLTNLLNSDAAKKEGGKRKWDQIVEMHVELNDLIDGINAYVGDMLLQQESEFKTAYQSHMEAMKIVLN